MEGTIAGYKDMKKTEENFFKVFKKEVPTKTKPFQVTNFKVQIPVRFCLGVGDQKTLVEGNLSIDLNTGRYKYPDELVFCLYWEKGKEQVVENRVYSSNWNRAEFYLPLKEGKKLLKIIGESVE